MEFETYTVGPMQIAPLKSGGTIPLTEARITLAGMETTDGRVKDHEYIVVRADPGKDGIHNFVTQRNHQNPNPDPDKKEPRVQSFRKLAMVKPSIGDNGLVFKWGDSNPITVPDENDLSKVLPVRVWEYEGGAVEVPQLTEWLRDVSGYNVRVVRTVGPWNRMSRQDYIRNQNPLRGQDGYPIHPILRSDVEAISQAGGVEVPWQRFRPQIVLEGGEPWSLHNAFDGIINGVRVIQPKPCGRCEVPRINQEDGEYSDIKPLVLIRQVRPYWVDNDDELQTIMGENWLPQGEVIVRTEDKFEVTSHRMPALKLQWKAGNRQA